MYERPERLFDAYDRTQNRYLAGNKWRTFGELVEWTMMLRYQDGCLSGNGEKIVAGGAQRLIGMTELGVSFRGESLNENFSLQKKEIES